MPLPARKPGRRRSTRFRSYYGHRFLDYHIFVGVAFFLRIVRRLIIVVLLVAELECTLRVCFC